MIPTGERISNAEELTNTNPTEGQKVGGNYQKGKVTINGLRISIENPKGSTRSGVDTDGTAWSNKMPYSYGYFNGTIGKDGDPIDVYLNTNFEENFEVYIIDQVEPITRAFDEHKVMFGFKDAESAKQAYMKCYVSGWKGFGNITQITLEKFKGWIKNKDMLKYPATRIRMSEKVNYSKYTNSASDRIHHIKLVGVVEEEVTLNELKKQAGDVSKFETLVCEIASPGGSVSEGLMIMVWLDQLSMMGKQIITVVSANAYSIASLIMLAADIKVISRHGKVMVHNPMIPELKYANANELEKYATELRDLESVMYELYQVFTGLDQGQIKALMDKETYLTPQEAVDNGFADVIVDIKQRSYEMTANNKKEINMSKTLNILNRVIGMVNKADYINQLYYDETGVEIEIFQNDPSTYSVGDRTDMAEGSVKLSDGSVLTIEGSIITEIGKAVETPIEAPIEAPMDAEFNEGAAPEKINAEHEEPMIHAPGEEMPMAEPAKQKGDMPATVIETTESVKTTKETVAQAEAKMDDDKQMKMGDDKEMKIDEDEAEMKPKAVMPMEDATKSDMDGDLKMLLGSMQKNMVALGEQIAALSEGQAKYDSKFKQIQNFEEIASEAIDALASSTVSNFKPAAKAVVEPVQTGSIFQKLKNSRGL
jgi:ATP-dependent protease ClpP protease subunit